MCSLFLAQATVGERGVEQQEVLPVLLVLEDIAHILHVLLHCLIDQLLALVALSLRSEQHLVAELMMNVLLLNVDFFGNFFSSKF